MRSARLLSSLAFLAAAAGASGCAVIETRSVVTGERVLSAVQEERPIAGVVTDVRQQGSTLVVHAARACSVVEVEEVERTVKKERFNKTPWRDWAFGIAGVGTAGAGVAMVAAAGNTRVSPLSNVDANAPATTRAIGISAIVLGAAMLAVPIADVIRASGEETEIVPAARWGREISRGVACAGAQPASKLRVAIDRPRTQLGQLDEGGTLQVDLAAAMRESLDRGGDPPEKLTVLLEGNAIGVVDGAPVYRAMGR